MSHLDAHLVRLYDCVFDRQPDPEGRAFWNNSLDQGYSLTVLADHFMRAPEFAATYGQPTNRQFVESLYSNILDRPGEEGGIAFWTAALDEGRAQRAETVVGFSESQEHVVQMERAAPQEPPVVVWNGTDGADGNETVVFVDRLVQHNGETLVHRNENFSSTATDFVL